MADEWADFLPQQTAKLEPKVDPWADFIKPQQEAAPPISDESGASAPADLTWKKAVQTADDYVRRIANAATFGLADKAAAKANELIGQGTYAQNLPVERARSEEAGQRLGPAASVADIGGGLLGGAAIAGTGLTALGNLPKTAGLVPRVLAGGAEGAAYGAAQGAGNTDTGSVLPNALKGAQTGAIVGAVAPPLLSAVGRVITPFPTDPTRQAAVRVLQQEGVPVSAGMRTGNETLRTAEDAVSKLPLGTAISRNPSSESLPALTQAVARKAGLPAGEVPTADVLEKGFRNVGGQIGAIQKTYPVQVDQTMLNEIVNISNDIPLLLSGRQSAALHFVDKLTSGQTLSPEVAQATRTQLNRAIRGQNGPNGDKDYQGLLVDLKNTLDDALTRTIQASGNAGHVAQLQQLRQQYANLHTLSDALFSSGAKGQLGQLTPGALQTAMARAMGRSGYMQGRGDLTPLASASKAILPNVPDSYTATREGILNPFKWALSLPAQLAVNSRPAQAYWGNQLLPQGAPTAISPPVISGLLAEEQGRRNRQRGLLSP